MVRPSGSSPRPASSRRCNRRGRSTPGV